MKKKIYLLPILLLLMMPLSVFGLFSYKRFIFQGFKPQRCDPVFQISPRVLTLLNAPTESTPITRKTPVSPPPVLLPTNTGVPRFKFR